LEKSGEKLVPHPEERRTMQARSSPSWFETAQEHHATRPVNHAPALTGLHQMTNFIPFRGHLSRPACSHVKQLAKQAGDKVIPAELSFRPDFLWPDFRGGFQRPSEGSVSRW
jgi:hypothetical protein